MLFANVFCFFVLFCVTHDSVCLFVFGFIFVPFILECLLLVFCCFCYLILIFLHLCVKKKKKEVMLHEFAVSNCMNFMQYKGVFSYPVFMQFK